MTKFRNVLLLISLVSFIYILRDHHSISEGFLTPHIKRLLKQGTISKSLCVDTEVTPASPGQINRAKGITSAIKRIRNGNKLVSFIEGPEPDDQFTNEYVLPVLAYGVPWIVFFALGIIGCITCSVNWMCMHYSWCEKYKICKKPKTMESKRGLRVSSIILMLFLFGAAIAGLIFSKEVRTGGRQTICSLGLLVDKLVEGSSTESDRWIGINPLIGKMEKAFQSFDINKYLQLSVSYSSAVTLSDTGLINAAYSPASGSVSTFYSTKNGRSVKNPDPSIGGTYRPSYIQNLASTRDNLINEMQEKRDKVIEASLNISTVLPILGGGSVFTLPIQNEINEMLEKASESSNNLTVQVQDTGSSGKNGVDAIAGSLSAVFAVKLVLGFASVVSIVLVWKGFQFFKKIMNFSWCFVAVFMIFGFALSTVLFPLALVLVEGCEVAALLSSDQSFYNKTFDKFLNHENYTEVREVLYSCFHGNGEVIEALDMKNYFLPFDPLFSSLDNTFSWTRLPTNLYVDSSHVIPAQKTLVGQLRNGMISDSAETDAALNKLNSLTNRQINQCTSIRDTWALNSQNCPAGSGAVFASSDSSNYNINNPTCIGFNAWGSTHQSNQRYTSSAFPQPNCGLVGGSNADVGLSDFVDEFGDSRQEVDQLFADIQSDLNNIENENENYMTVIKSATARITTVRFGVEPIYQSLANKTGGILPNSNCKWVLESYNSFQETMCVKFVSATYRAAVTIIIASFLGFFGSFTLFYLARRSAAGESPLVKG